MPANVEKMFSVREGTWHGLEDQLADYPTLDEVKDYFGFTVVPATLGFNRNIEDPWSEYVQVDGMQALTRSDTGAFLSAVNNTYGIVQPDVVVDLTEAIVKGNTDYPVRITTGGLLNEGRVMWTLTEVDHEWFVDGDDSPIKPYVLLVNSFDGSYALMARTTGVRVVCQNTLDLSVAQKGGGVFRFKHTTNVMDRVNEARRILRGATQAVGAFVDMSNDLVRQPVTTNAVNLFLAAFIPEPPELKKTDSKMASIIEAREAVLAILHGATGTVTPTHSNTAYGLYQAGVEFLDYNRPSKNADTLFTRTMLRQDTAKADLLKLVHAAAKV